MGMMQSANIVSPSAAAAPGAGQSDEGQSDADRTLIVNRKGSKGMLAVTVIGILLGAAAAIFVAYRLFGGGGGGTVAADVSHVESKSATPDVSAANDGLPASCLGDLSQASEQHKFYCWYYTGFMPWKRAVDTHVAESGGIPATGWILILLLGANSVVTWIVLLRRRKRPS